VHKPGNITLCNVSCDEQAHWRPSSPSTHWQVTLYVKCEVSRALSISSLGITVLLRVELEIRLAATKGGACYRGELSSGENGCGSTSKSKTCVSSAALLLGMAKSLD